MMVSGTFKFAENAVINIGLVRLSPQEWPKKVGEQPSSSQKKSLISTPHVHSPLEAYIWSEEKMF